jgi:hypothetical protein
MMIRSASELFWVIELLIIYLLYPAARLVQHS